MSVKIRLRRMGANKRPFFRVVVTDSRNPVRGGFIESIGWYNPISPTGECRVKMDRLEYWTGHGAQMSTNVKALVKRATPYAQEPAAAQPEAAEPAEG